MKNVERVYNLNFREIYGLYLQKVERKGRTEAELMEILSWLTGYSGAQLHEHVAQETTLKDLCDTAPGLSETVPLITGVICGYRVEEIDDPTMQRIRAMDKVVDELAKGKKIEKIKREGKLVR